MVVCTLSELLEQRGMSRRELARQAGVTANSVGNLARAHYASAPIVSLRTLSRVCATLKIEPGLLFRCEDETMKV